MNLRTPARFSTLLLVTCAGFACQNDKPKPEKLDNSIPLLGDSAKVIADGPANGLKVLVKPSPDAVAGVAYHYHGSDRYEAVMFTPTETFILKTEYGHDTRTTVPLKPYTYPLAFEFKAGQTGQFTLYANEQPLVTFQANGKVAAITNRGSASFLVTTPATRPAK